MRTSRLATHTRPGLSSDNKNLTHLHGLTTVSHLIPAPSVVDRHIVCCHQGVHMYLLALPELRAAQNPTRSTAKSRCCSSPCTPTGSSTSMRSASTCAGRCPNTNCPPRSRSLMTFPRTRSARSPNPACGNGSPRPPHPTTTSQHPQHKTQENCHRLHHTRLPRRSSERISVRT